MFQYLNVELTNLCNYDCPFCGRHKARKEGTMELGDMDIKLFERIVAQFRGDILQFNKDGEVLLYPHLWRAGYVSRMGGKITNIVTNGLLLWEKREEVLEFDTICVSVHRDDPEQFESVKRFTEHCDIPVLIKFLGDYINLEYEKLGLRTTRRAIHQPMHDNHYQRKPVIPELNICFDFLLKPSINWKGQFSMCNRYDPEGKGIIGDCNTHTLKEIWNSEKRKIFLDYHICGERNRIPMCKDCQFWGVPVS